MVKVSPRMKKFLREFAVETGAAQEFAGAGAEERAKEIARSMIVDNEPVEKIAKHTGLDIADIVMLQSAML